MKSEPRRYEMRARASAAEETGKRIVAAMQSLFAERPFEAITLDAVAERAGVTLQTVLRRFGSKAGLFAAAAAGGLAEVERQRGQAPADDLPAAMDNLYSHYEQWGDVALRLVAQEERFEEVAQVTARGRAAHAAWVDRVFAAELRRLPRAARTRRRAQLIAICDVSVWKLLRRDLGLSRKAAQAAALEIVEGLSARGGSR
jgi:AcrR family transcriptional regulator